MDISLKRALALGFVSVGILTLGACESEGPLESAGEAVDEAADDAKDAVEDAADDAADAVDDAVDDAGDGLDDAAKELDDDDGP